MRPITGIITVLLPLARHLNATEILSIIMALFVFCVIWESIASLRSGAHVFERWTETDYPDQCYKEKPTAENDKDERALP